MDRRVGDEVIGEGVAGWIVVGGGCGGELGGAVDKSPVITTKNRPSSPTSLLLLPPPLQPGGRKQTPTTGCFDPLVVDQQQEKSSTMDNQVQHQNQPQQEIEMTRTTPSVLIESSPLASDQEVGAEYGELDDVYYTGYQSGEDDDEEAEEVDEDLEDLEEEQEDDDDDDEVVEEEEEEEVDGQDGEEEEEDDGLPYPGFVPVTLGFMTQYSRPRNFCLRMITNPYPFFAT